MVDNTINAKQCLVCEEAKPLAAFRPDARKADGLESTCGECRRSKKSKRAILQSLLLVGKFRCCHCGEIKAISEFRKEPRALLRVHSRCQVCERLYHQNWQRLFREKNADYYTSQFRRRRYGLSEIEFASMLAAQDGRCAICGRSDHKKYCIDHDNSMEGPGRRRVPPESIRGVLCNDCNVGLGCFRDNISALEAAIAYLKKHGGPNGRRT